VSPLQLPTHTGRKELHCMAMKLFKKTIVAYVYAAMPIRGVRKNSETLPQFFQRAASPNSVAFRTAIRVPSSLPNFAKKNSKSTRWVTAIPAFRSVNIKTYACNALLLQAVGGRPITRQPRAEAFSSTCNHTTVWCDVTLSRWL